MSYNKMDITKAAHLLGYKKIPPTIDEFLTSPYYLGDILKGSIYPFWREHLKDIFPTAIHTRYKVIVLTGSTGTGKSTFAKIVALYNEARLIRLRNLLVFGIAVTKPIAFVFFHTTREKANKEFIDSLQFIKSRSPFFINERMSYGESYYIPDGVRGNSDALGSDAIFFNLSELNFVNPKIAESRINQAMKRWRTRFEKAEGFIGNIILDSSSKGKNSVVNNFIQTHKNIKVISTNLWEVKRHLGIYFNKGCFWVYTGDEPFIIENEKELEKIKKRIDIDEDAIIKVPLELYDDFKRDIYTALQDLAGVSISEEGKYMHNTDILVNAMTIENPISEIIKVDFFDINDKIFNKIKPALINIPMNMSIFIHIDIGVVNDITGIAITYVSPESKEVSENIRRPKFITPVILGISRYSGQETSIYHIEEFIIELNNHFNIELVTADQYGSRQLIQDLTREGINARLLSVDKDAQPYITFKNLVKMGLWEGVKHQKLIKEIQEMRMFNNKVDHPEDGSKDIADVVVGSVYSAYISMERFNEYGDIKAKKTIEAIKSMRKITKWQINREYKKHNIWDKIYEKRKRK